MTHASSSVSRMLCSPSVRSLSVGWHIRDFADVSTPAHFFLAAGYACRASRRPLARPLALSAKAYSGAQWMRIS
jgi:hypothetical protein